MKCRDCTYGFVSEAEGHIITCTCYNFLVAVTDDFAERCTCFMPYTKKEATHE